MRCKPYTTLVVVVGVLLALVTLVPVHTGAEAPAAIVMHVEGATRMVQVRDWDGKLVEVEVPSRSFQDIQRNDGGQRVTSSTMEQDKGTVMATVVAVDGWNNRVKVLTQQGQTIVLETPARDIQVGEKLALVVPR